MQAQHWGIWVAAIIPETMIALLTMQSPESELEPVTTSFKRDAQK
jgi:hypothetical protein